MNNKGLELLFDYTKFHIGVYLTLAAGYIALATASFRPVIYPTLVWTAVGFTALAGFAGGVIASSITQTDKTDVKSFLEDETGPWNLNKVKAKYWIYVEHTAFWIGILCVIFSFQSHV